MSDFSTYLKSTAIIITCKFVRFLPSRRGNVLLAPHIPVENLGDSALLVGGVTALRKEGLVHVIETGSNSVLDCLVQNNVMNGDITIDDTHQLFFATPHSFKETIGLVWKARQYDRFFIVGADVLDGFYEAKEAYQLFYFASLMAQAGKAVTILGSSYSERISDLSISGLKLCSNAGVKVLARDYFSQQRASEYCKVGLSADIAFLMKPATETPSYDHDADSYSNYLKVGLCVKDSDLNSEQSLSALLNALGELKKTVGNLLLLSLPHHKKDKVSLESFFLTAEAQGFNVIKPIKMPVANEIKAVAGQCDLVVTGRMHVAIAALGMGIPAIAYSYNNKFEGLFKHFDLDPNKYVIDEADKVDPSFVKKVILGVAEELSSTKESVKSALDNVRALAWSNFD